MSSLVLYVNNLPRWYQAFVLILNGCVILWTIGGSSLLQIHHCWYHIAYMPNLVQEQKSGPVTLHPCYHVLPCSLPCDLWISLHQKTARNPWLSVCANSVCSPEPMAISLHQQCMQPRTHGYQFAPTVHAPPVVQASIKSIPQWQIHLRVNFLSFPHNLKVFLSTFVSFILAPIMNVFF